MPDLNSSDSQQDSNPRWGKLGLTLRRSEQTTMFGILLVCGVILAVYFLQLYLKHDNVVDIDDVPIRKPQYLIDINQAEWPELANIPGIGEKLAKSIVDHRTKYGNFDCVESLQKVKGIGLSKMEAIEPYLMPIQENSGEMVLNSNEN